MRLWQTILSVILLAGLAGMTAPAFSAPRDHREARPNLNRPIVNPDKTERGATRGLKGGAAGPAGSAARLPPPAPGKAGRSPKPAASRVTCMVERVCQVMKRPVREVVTECRMMKPSPDAPARRLCTERIANAERSGPELCRSAHICKVRDSVSR